MSFTTFSGFNNPFFSARTVTSPNTATFGALSTLGQVPLVGISGKFATYSVINNGTNSALPKRTLRRLFAVLRIGMKLIHIFVPFNT